MNGLPTMKNTIFMAIRERPVLMTLFYIGKTKCCWWKTMNQDGMCWDRQVWVGLGKMQFNMNSRSSVKEGFVYEYTNYDYYCLYDRKDDLSYQETNYVFAGDLVLIVHIEPMLVYVLGPRGVGWMRGNWSNNFKFFC